jgi:hypothetical protein
MCLHFDYYLSYEFKCGVFPLWHHIPNQKVLDFGTLWILGFELENLIQTIYMHL